MNPARSVDGGNNVEAQVSSSSVPSPLSPFGGKPKDPGISDTFDHCAAGAQCQLDRARANHFKMAAAVREEQIRRLQDVAEAKLRYSRERAAAAAAREADLEGNAESISLTSGLGTPLVVPRPSPTPSELMNGATVTDPGQDRATPQITSREAMRQRRSAMLEDVLHTKQALENTPIKIKDHHTDRVNEVIADTSRLKSGPGSTPCSSHNDCKSDEFCGGGRGLSKPVLSL